MKKTKRQTASRVYEEFTILVPDSRMNQFANDGSGTISLCGLCANSGIIKTLGTFSTYDGDKVNTGIRGFCICPNGRAIKRSQGGMPKWGSTSLTSTVRPVHISRHDYEDRQ